MIEITLYDYLTEALDVPVYAEIPAAKPATYVTFEKTGSSLSNHIYSSMFAVQSYAPTLLGAAELNEVVKQAMLAAPETVSEITSVDLNSDYNYTDPGTAQYRYQAVYDIYHY